MMKSEAALQGEVEGLREENADLRRANADLSRRIESIENLQAQQAERRSTALSVAAFLGLRVAGYGGIVSALKGWRQKASSSEPFPIGETEELIGAVISRMTRVGLFQLFLAIGGAVGTGVLVWHGFLMKEQTASHKEQIMEQVEMRKQIAAETSAAHRGQMDEALFGSKRRFVREYLAEQREQGSNVELSGASLQGVSLADAKLSKVKLRKADLRAAYLRGADLTEANLIRADLRDADLSHAILSNANLNCARLSDADLHRADFTAANLEKATFTYANLSSASLTGARNLDPRQILDAVGNSETKIPLDWQRPEHWGLSRGAQYAAIEKILEAESPSNGSECRSKGADRWVGN